MNKIFTILALSAILTGGGCAANPQKIQIVSTTKPIGVPILYSPAPPVITRPDLPIKTMTPAQLKVDGETAKAYVASVQALIDYSEQEEDIVAQYKKISDSYINLRAKLANDWKSKTGQDLDLSNVPEQPETIKPTPRPSKQ